MDTSVQKQAVLEFNVYHPILKSNTKSIIKISFKTVEMIYTF